MIKAINTQHKQQFRLGPVSIFACHLYSIQHTYSYRIRHLTQKRGLHKNAENGVCGKFSKKKTIRRLKSHMNG